MNRDLIAEQVVIKTFYEQQRKPCIKLYQETFGKPPWNEDWSLKSATSVINKIISKKYFNGLVAELNNQGVGYLLGYRLNMAYPLPNVFYISELFVDVEFQNLKIGKKLVLELIDELRNELKNDLRNELKNKLRNELRNDLVNDLGNKRISWVILITKKDTPAEAFYKRMGFRRGFWGLSIKNRIIMSFNLEQTSLEDDHE